jgi:hypothetical protein
MNARERRWLQGAARVARRCLKDRYGALHEARTAHR